MTVCLLFQLGFQKHHLLLQLQRKKNDNLKHANLPPGGDLNRVEKSSPVLYFGFLLPAYWLSAKPGNVTRYRKLVLKTPESDIVFKVKIKIKFLVGIISHLFQLFLWVSHLGFPYELFLLHTLLKMFQHSFLKEKMERSIDGPYQLCNP